MERLMHSYYYKRKSISSFSKFFKTLDKSVTVNIQINTICNSCSYDFLHPSPFNLLHFLKTQFLKLF